MVRRTTAVAPYFGAQVRKARIKAGLNILQLANLTGIDNGHLGRIERGQRNPTPDIARRLDSAFDTTDFTELYEASRSWVPAQFRQWADFEDQATRLMVWSPDIVDGLLQTESYARCLLQARIDNEEIVTSRLRSRMNRQKRIVFRDDPPHIFFVVDEMALYRRVGSPEIMAEQLQHLLKVSRLPHVSVAVMPPVEHCSHESEFIIADNAVYAEHVIQGGVYQEKEVSEALAWFSKLLGESYRAADSVAVIERTEAIWASGGSPLTAVAAAGRALKSEMTREPS